MMQKRQREKKIGQYIQAKCVNGFPLFFDIHQTVTVRTSTKKKKKK